MNNSQQKRNPQKVIDSFCADIDLDEAKKTVKQCLEIAITTENHHFESAKERYFIFYFSHRLEELIEAAYVLKSKKKSK